MSAGTRFGVALAASVLLGAAGIGVAGYGTSSLPKNAEGASPSADPTDSVYVVTTRRDRIGRITAPVMINGQGPFRFMVDTGSNRTVIAQDTLARLGLASDSTSLVNVTGIAGSQLAPTVHIERLDAGDLHFHDLDMPVLSGPVLLGVDGILGMDGFAGMKVTADFRRGRITIVHSRNQRPALSYSVMNVVFLSDRLLMVDAKLGRVPVKAIIDTGGEHTLGNAALLDALSKGHQSSGKPLEKNVIGVTPVGMVGTIDHAPTFRLGDMQISDLDVVCADFQIFKTWGLEDQPAILIGMDVLGTLEALQIDYRRKEVDFLPHYGSQPTLDRRWFSLDSW
jgi:predicted aspartyl protease